MSSTHTPQSQIRAQFSRAMSDMYRAEVPQYGTLMSLVADVNADVIARVGAAAAGAAGQEARLEVERHGAIRVGTPAELSTIRRLFAVMGMFPVGYYDLSVAGVPVHSTAFRPRDTAGLADNPFRVFTSLLRLDLIQDVALREAAAQVLSQRSIFTPGCIALIERAEQQGGLDQADAAQFVAEALETFRWHGKSTVTADLYWKLRKTHPLIADIVCFPGPHINHLTPRTLDIDLVQAQMPARGIRPKAVVEGPPTRKCPILLRQTSFLALSEPVSFVDGGEAGTHTARFGEIEQRGVALTPKGRQLYDSLLAEVRKRIEPAGDGSNADAYRQVLGDVFRDFPDTHDALRQQGLAYYRYTAGNAAAPGEHDVEALIAAGALVAEPITYEDFLPVSAAGIFQSNLGNERRDDLQASPNRAAFESALGATVSDELALYAAAQQASLDAALQALGITARA
ncbi:2-oxoadipate dioxygenase/decarboxylase HglS [Cupriavidus pauculus]|uniref:2-oxoadipate dioxygenase/decarboxylase HglS n=1 Tax=Cupriavidus pauculus TaxID=82633 RepID=UPI00124788B5|nr:VOC family protein [Cupriavidus pauculus]KAB0605244.1 VOC family protein [Cupriavidus pauculus]MCM3605148.1 VOC family protein [Cupriavidus pauculus]UAK99605.1 VOC family protein [Cupriavidus pauculus]